MGRPKRLYPLGKYRFRTPKEVDKEKAYPVELEYTWNRQIIRKTTNVFAKVPTVIRTAIKDVASYAQAMAANTNGSTSCCWRV